VLVVPLTLLPTATDVATYDMEVCYMGLTTLLPIATDAAVYGIEVCYMGLAALLPTATTAATYSTEVCYMWLAAVLQACLGFCYNVSGEVPDEIGFATLV